MKREVKKYSPEVRERAVRMVLEHAAEYPWRWAAECSVAAKIDCSTATLHEWESGERSLKEHGPGCPRTLRKR